MRLLSYSLAGLLALTPASLVRVLAAPAPSLTFYGMLTDEFGWPYADNVKVTVTANGLVVLSQPLQPATGRNYNFIFRLPYDTGVVDYSSASVTAGDVITITVAAADSGKVLIQRTQTVTVAPGTVLNLNLATSTDSVGDGLPDELRFWIWQSLGLSGAFDPTKIKAIDDSDGDGVSNLNEYLAGTDPANASDVFQVTITDSGVPNVARLNFFSVPSKTYQMQVGQITGDTTIWNPALFASSPQGQAHNTSLIGTGHFISAFVPTGGTNMVFRVAISNPPVNLHIVP